jgi:transcriptional regulator with XRE-family HTH domain
MIDERRMPHPRISAAQLRAARAWLEISQEELAVKAGVGRRAIADFERGARLPYDRTLEQLRVALEALGMQFMFEGMRGIGVVDERSVAANGEE